MRQVALLPSGVQISNQNTILYYSDDYILFSSSLAVYVLHPKTFQVEKILSCTQKTISAISVNPSNKNILAVSSVDGSVTTWGIAEEQIISKANLNYSVSVAWDPFDVNRCAIVCLVNVRLLLWDITRANNGLVEIFSVRSETLKPILIRWSVSVAGLIAIGCNSGTTFLFNLKQMNHKVLQLPDKKGDVTDIQWDRLSTSYLLIAYSNNLALWDSTTLEILMSFEKQPLGITSISWMEWTAGNFVSANGRNSHLKIWNASQKTAVRSVKVPYNSAITGITFNANMQRGLLSFQDGTVAVYDLDRNRLEYKSQPGHTETIFSCKLSPVTPDQFATASYDGTIKIWEINQLRLLKTLYGNGEFIYCVDWSLAGRVISASLYSGMIMLWNPKTGRELLRLTHNSKASYSLEWNPFNENLLLTTSADFSATIYDVNIDQLLESEISNIALGSAALGTSRGAKNAEAAKVNTDQYALIKFRFFHPAPVFGCAWNRFKPTVFSTACQDGVVRIFNYATQALVARTCVGHSARVFSCSWSPLVPGLLATGADDYNVLVWEVDVDSFATDAAGLLTRDNSLTISVSSVPVRDELSPKAFPTIIATKSPPKNALSAVRVLQGHKSYVRALSWNHENRHLLFSGSWDCSIRIWNIMTGSCLTEINHHVADVYSLVSHRDRPFTYISCSRDTTVRIWEVEGIFRVLRYYCLWDEGFRRAISAEETSDNPPTSSLLSPTLADAGENQKSRAAPGEAGVTASEEDRAYFPSSLLSLDETMNEFALSPIPTMATTPSLALYGARSHALHKEMERQKRSRTSSTSRLESKEDRKIWDGHVPTGIDRSIDEELCLTSYYYQIFGFFMNCNGSMDLLEVVLQQLQHDLDRSSSSSPSRSTMTVSVSHLIRSKEYRKVFAEHEILALAYSEVNSLQVQRDMAVATGASAPGSNSSGGTILARSNKDSAESMENALQEQYLIFQYLKLQEYEKAIDLLVMNEQWELAITLAPMVSLDYWRRLSGDYGEMLQRSFQKASNSFSAATAAILPPNLGAKKRGGGKNNLSALATSDERCIPYFLVSGNTEAAINYYLSQRDYSSAKILGQLMTSSSALGRQLVKEKICKAIVSQYLAQGQSILASAELIAIHEVDLAIELLYRCGEIDLAYCLSQCFAAEREMDTVEAGATRIKGEGKEQEDSLNSSLNPNSASFLRPPRLNCTSSSFAVLPSTLYLGKAERNDFLLVQWADRCASYHAIDLAIAILQDLTYPEHQELEIALLLSKHCNETRHRKFLQQYNLKSLNYYQTSAKEQEMIGTEEEVILSNTLSRQFHKAIACAIPYLKRYLREPWEMMMQPCSKKTSLAANGPRLYQILKRIRLKEITDESLRLTFQCSLLWFAAHEAWLVGLFQTSTSMLSVLLSGMQGNGDKSINLGLSREEVLFQQFLSYLFSQKQENCLKLCKDLMEEMSQVNNQTIKEHLQRLYQLLTADNGQGWNYWTDYAAGRSFAFLNGLNRPKEGGSEGEQVVQLVLREIQSLSSSLSLPSIFHANQSHGSSLTPPPTARNPGQTTCSHYDFLQRLLSIPSPVVLGSSLPVANQKLKQYRSYLTLQRIQGSSVALDASEFAVISSNEAMEWTLIYPYSPLLNGEFLLL